MIEAFDVSLVFPRNYRPTREVRQYAHGQHDDVTTELLRGALRTRPKPFLSTQWDIYRTVRQVQLEVLGPVRATNSRYRIGLLHLYLLQRFLLRRFGELAADIGALLGALVPFLQEEVRLQELCRSAAFQDHAENEVHACLEALALVNVRTGKNPRPFLSLRNLEHGGNTVIYASVNTDLRTCLGDLVQHAADDGLLRCIDEAFVRFDERYGVPEALDDMESTALVEQKERFVRQVFRDCLDDVNALAGRLIRHAKIVSPNRREVCAHQSNWVFEMLLYITGLNSAEDIHNRFKVAFEASGHRLRDHAPYGGQAQTIMIMLQGRDLCEQWNETNQNRSLGADEFRDLCWRAVAHSVVEAFQAVGGEARSADEVIRKYRDSKSMRIISSDLNGLEIMVEMMLGDLCVFTFTEPDADKLAARICASWQTDMVNSLWNGRPLETWLEGASRNGRWLVKVQSSQDGHEADKAKEVAGRCRCMKTEWASDGNPRNRNSWHFGNREMKRLALVLDGDWSVDNKRNLYEAGWDWAGDISELDDLRERIQADD